MTTRDQGRFTRHPQTFARRVEAEVWADLKAHAAAAHKVGDTYQERAMFLTAVIDTAAERLQWIGAA